MAALRATARLQQSFMRSCLRWQISRCGKISLSRARSTNTARFKAIGGVNEKIEGFFDVCAARGLTGTQGVLIPKSNVQHLMLRQDVIHACAQGKFGIYPIVTIDEGIALLTGRAAGRRGAEGAYPPDSINGLIEARLRSFARALERARRALSHEQGET
jgi:hypothetical protein